MRRKPSLIASLDDPSLPSPLTSRNLRPRSETRILRSGSNSRGGSSRSSRASSSLSNSSLMPPMPPTGAIAGPSSRPMLGVKRKRSGSLDVGRKRGNAPLVEEEDEEEDELEEDSIVETPPVPDAAAGSGSSHANTQSQSVQSPPSPLFIDSSPAPPKNSPLSPGLGKLLDPENSEPRLTTTASPPAPTSPKASGSRAPMIVNSPAEFTVASGSKLQRSPPSPSPSPPPRTEPEPLSAYSCPICFFPPTNATLTPCGHVCCGSCLFTAVKTMTQRGAMMPESSVARCPVCRAQIHGWDGKGGGVIGLKVRAVFSL
ncbi:hypothetical protein C8J57DRAFT_119280 [Mycena rebaudengoi]|nr:hypothetical protein C8J57DRAFT_119280 [Mycena rebaudengoi]